VDIAIKEAVRYFRGSEKDKLMRWRDACTEYNIDKFVSIDADDPFFDGALSHQSIKTLGDALDIVKHPVQQPNNGYYEGCVGYSIRLDVIEKACDIKKTDDTEMMWNFIEKVSDVRVEYLQVENDDVKCPIRLTLDYEEDYWLMNYMVRILDQFPDRQKVVNLFKANPDLYKINWFRNDDYKAAQIDRSV
jgi:spore coat polysaccharide biosynthesis protein SpsF